MTRHPKGRSAVTNGTRVHLQPVPDTEHARRYRDLLEQAESERGGRAAMSVSAQQAARAWAGLAILLERQHMRMAMGEDLTPNEIETMGQIGDRMDRQSRRMGPVKAKTAQTLEQRLAERGSRR